MRRGDVTNDGLPFVAPLRRMKKHPFEKCTFASCVKKGEHCVECGEPRDHENHQEHVEKAA